jgi:hypothetical protein
MEPRPLVVAAPRSAFSLLIHIATSILSKHRQPDIVNLRDAALRELVDLCSRLVTQEYRRVFASSGITSDLIFNGEFHFAAHSSASRNRWERSGLPRRTRALIRPISAAALLLKSKRSFLQK